MKLLDRASKRFYLWLTFSAVVTMLCIPMTGCKKSGPTPEVEATVQAAKPETGTISELIGGDAILAPIAQAAIAPKISAPIKMFYVQRGAHVKAGQLLVSLEDSDLRATELDNRGSYAAAEANFQQATGAQIPEDVQKAELDVAQAKANLDLNKSIVNGRKQLFSEGAIAGRDLDTAQAALVEAQATYDTASQHLQSVQKIGRASADKAAEGQLNSAKGKYQNAEAMASYASLRSPIDGVVTDRSLFAGEMAAPGIPLITVMDTSSLLAKLHLAQAATFGMKVGDKAKVTISGMQEPVEGTISFISPALDPGSTTVEVWVLLKNSDGKLKAGTPAHVAITGRTVHDALIVPTGSLLTGTDGSLGVMVVGTDGAAHRKPVKIGIRLSDDTQILSGVTPDDMVISSGAYGLDEGTKVKVGKAGDDDPDAKGGKE
jgi:HlyD family secretion protein